MLQVMSLPLASLRPEFREGFLSLPAFLMGLPVDLDVKSLIATYKIEGDHVDFLINMQGVVELVPSEDSVPHFTSQQSLARMNFENRREILLNAIGNTNTPAAAFLRTILQHPQYMVTVDQIIPVVIPFRDHNADHAASGVVWGQYTGATNTAAAGAGAFDAGAGAVPLSGVGAGGAVGTVGAAGVDAGGASGVGAVGSGAGAEAAAAGVSASGAAAGVATAAATKRSLVGVVLWSVLAILLLGGSLFGYYKTLYPWPFIDEQKIAEAERQKANELLEQRLTGLLDKADLRLDQAYTMAGQHEAQGAINAINLLTSLQAKDQAAAIIAAQQAQKAAEEAAAQAKAEAERLAKEEAERQAKAQAEAERLAKAEAERLAKAEAERQAQAQAEAERLANLEKAEAERKAKAKAEAERLAQKAAAAKKPVSPATPASPASQDVAAQSQKPDVLKPAVPPEQQAAQTAQSADNKGVLPKCETIKQQGKVPVLLFALDGSGSMESKMEGSKERRRDSALKATNVLLNRIDKNVDIHAFGIKGCPSGKDFGVFHSGSRSSLKLKFASMFGIQGVFQGAFTPLNGIIQRIGSAAPADVDATAIVISDGLNTCSGSGKLCDIVSQIHASKPKLKIHIVYLGNKSEVKNVECVAKLTNGMVFNPKNAAQLVQNIEKASQTLVKVCQ